MDVDGGAANLLIFGCLDRFRNNSRELGKGILEDVPVIGGGQKGKADSLSSLLCCCLNRVGASLPKHSATVSHPA